MPTPSHVLMTVAVETLKPGDIWMSTVNDYDVISLSDTPEMPNHVQVELRFQNARNPENTFTVTHLRKQEIRAFIAYQK